MAAMPMVIGLFLIDKDTSPLAGVTPLQVALAILALGSFGFLIRVFQHYAELNQPMADKAEQAPSAAPSDHSNAS